MPTLGRGVSLWEKGRSIEPEKKEISAQLGGETTATSRSVRRGKKKNPPPFLGKKRATGAQQGKKYDCQGYRPYGGKDCTF